MPIYNFQCKNKKCGEQFSELVTYDDTNKYENVKCPHCQSKKKNRLLTTCNFAFAQPEGTDKWNNEATGHDYRFKTKLPSVLSERARAERASHMGTNPYKEIDDISSGKYFGEVK